ncbi:MAG: peptidoglycan DD-metalloendopeptidase family protein [Synechococcaceae cyanobacterium SM2_3_60]|nr:peptidoglycan DD-metalloendopeptidase family protein [Synechococcaceae cyanobacterium SM2_3_60]
MVRHRRWFSCLTLGFGLITALVWLIYSPQIAAQSIDELEQQREGIQRQLEDARQQAETLRQQEQEAQGQLNRIRENINVTNARIEDNLYRLERAEREMAALAVQLEASEAQLVQQQAQAGARLRYLQQQGQERWWAVLLDSHDFNQFAERQYFLALLWDSDRQLIQEIQETARRIEAERFALEAQRNEIALINQELATQRDQLEVQASSAAATVARIGSDRAAFEAAQQRLEADSQQLTSLIQDLIASQTVPDDPPQGTGQLMMPVNGPVTSPFGWRVHPIYGTSRLHAGIDFGVPTGTTVYSADRGTVIFAGWYGGYGVTVIVNHGGGITTLYAHNSQALVSEGQAVERGTPVAASGSTGLSTGPHVHFEVRINGQPVDPAGYF